MGVCEESGPKFVPRLPVFKRGGVHQIGHAASGDNLSIKHGIKVQTFEQSNSITLDKHGHFIVVIRLGRSFIAPELIYPCGLGRSKVGKLSVWAANEGI